MDDSPEAAANTVSLWIKSLNHAARTGDTSGLEEFSADDCEPCARYVAELQPDGSPEKQDIWIREDEELTVYPEPPVVIALTATLNRDGESVSQEIQFKLSVETPYKIDDLVFVERS